MKATLELRLDKLAEHRVRTGLLGEQDLADAMGANRATVNKVLNGRAKAGPDFIASMLHALKGATFADLWQVVTDGAQ